MMKILFVVALCLGCVYCEVLIDWSNMNGNNYLGHIKDQRNTGMCWAFASVSFLEANYNILTNNLYTLSAEQLGDNVDEYFQEHDVERCSMQRPSYNGGFESCALNYVQKKGIMTEYDYPFTNGGEKYGVYDEKIVTPIGVRNVTVFDIDESYERFGGDNIFKSPEEVMTIILSELLHRGVVLGQINSGAFPRVIWDETDTYTKNIFETQTTDHAILITGAYQNENDSYVIIQNSWGIMDGSNGFRHILISEGEEVYNNLGILSKFTFGEIYNKYTTYEEENKVEIFYYPEATKNNETTFKCTIDGLDTIGSIVVWCFIFLLIIIFAMIVHLCNYCYRFFSDKKKKSATNQHVELTEDASFV
jgi:hypothetical protein